VGVFGTDLRGQLLVAGDGRARSPVEDLFDQVSTLDALDAVLAVDTLFYLPTDLLVKMDITSMANSLEARSPLLDDRLVEFAAQLPTRLKVHGRTTKYLLKRAFADAVPSENLHREKRGFAVPIADWFRHDLRDYVRDYLLSARAMQRGLFDRSAVERLVGDHVSGRTDHAHHLWVLLMLELWHREFEDRSPIAAASAGQPLQVQT
jgi:asparagine synthase (glutamine-hydrolysing)